MKQTTRKKGNVELFKIETGIISGEFIGKKKDSDGNVESGFVGFDDITLKEYIKRLASWKKEYPIVPKQGYLLEGAHRIVIKTNETLNNGIDTKRKKRVRVQEIYQNGKWRSMRPNKEGQHVEVLGEEKPWYKTVKAWCVGVILACIAAYLKWG